MIREDRIQDKQALQAVKAAMNNLLLRVPLVGLTYYGEAIEVVEHNQIDTMMVDGRAVYYSPKWVLSQSLRGNTFDLLHEWVHIYMNHTRRRGDRDRDLWAIVIDVVAVYEASKLLSKPGDHWDYPEDGIIPPKWYCGESAEQLYDKYAKSGKCTRPKSDKSIRNGKDVQSDINDPYAEFKDVQFLNRFTAELAQAANVIQQTGQSLAKVYGENFVKRLDEVLKGKLPWGRLLKGRILGALGTEVATFAPPRRKYYPKLILPQYRSRKEKIVMIIVDVSASVGEHLMKVFISNVVPAASRAETIYVVTFDCQVREVIKTRRPGTLLKQVQFLSGSHTYTSTVGVFKLVDEIKPTAFTILTDGFVELPKKKYPDTLWILPRGGSVPPWGKHYIMDISW